MMSGIFRLEFEYTENGNINFNSVILKIPSLSFLPFAKLKPTNMFDREVYFYKILLPELYMLGNCEPFTPKLYTATETTALVLEDL